MLNSERVKKHNNKNSNWQPTREEFQRMAIKYDAMLKHVERHADDPTAILSCLYNDIIEKYCNLRGELRELRQINAELRRMNMILKMALERRSKQQQQKDTTEELERW